MPCSGTVAERIARRELELVLRRSGMARRSLAVDADPSVISLLVREGYSPHFGARPLKRTVERHVLLPLARFIAGTRGREHSVLSLVARDNRVEVRVVSEPPRVNKTPAQGATQEEPDNRVAAELTERLNAVEAGLGTMQSRKSELVAMTVQPGFFDRQAERDAVFDELHRLDEFLARCRALREGVDRFVAGAARNLSGTESAAVVERRDELISELEQLEFVSSARDAPLLADAWISISLVKAEGDALDAVRKLAETYRGMAARRHLQAEILAERWDEARDEVHLKISGLGALALFISEAGLHDFHSRRRTKSARTGKEQVHKDTSLVRVEVLPVGASPDKRFVRAVETRVTAVKPPRSRLVAKAGWSVRVFHAEMVRSVEAWLGGSKEEALSHALDLLCAQVRAEEQGRAAVSEVVRRYDLGIGSQIKDLRSGKSTTRLAQFFAGKVDLAPVRAAK
ncbi:MAG: hypothetical protein IPK15_21075 [Verrucomicrobia bacterium]|nr:hypothetical protein [Verrucomicrobiota bacterium]